MRSIIYNSLKDISNKYFDYNQMRFFYSMRIHRSNHQLETIVEKNKLLHNKHVNERCFIIANGPSTKSLDFSLLSNEFVFTMNQLPRRADFSDLHTNIHFWTDYRLFSTNDNLVGNRELLQIMKNVNGTDINTKPMVFYSYSGYSFVKQHDLDKILNVNYFINIGKWPRSVHRDFDFSDIVPMYSTTVIYEILLAVYMGFSTIYLLGCDCTGFISTAEQMMNHAEKSLYSYSITDNEKRRMESVIKSSTIRDELQSWVEIFDQYKFCLQYCKDRQVSLINLTSGGLLNDIPRARLEDVL